MAKYILNKKMQGSKSGKNFEVHNEVTCQHLPDSDNRLDLGNQVDCHSAKSFAKSKYPKNAKDIDGCYYCSYPCHVELAN